MPVGKVKMLTSCSQHWSSSFTVAGFSDRHNADAVCDGGVEVEYVMAASVATCNWHYSACCVLFSSKVGYVISSGSDVSDWRGPEDCDGSGRSVHSREGSGWSLEDRR